MSSMGGSNIFDPPRVKGCSLQKSVLMLSDANLIQILFLVAFLNFACDSVDIPVSSLSLFM